MPSVGWQWFSRAEGRYHRTRPPCNVRFTQPRASEITKPASATPSVTRLRHLLNQGAISDGAGVVSIVMFDDMMYARAESRTVGGTESGVCEPTAVWQSSTRSCVLSCFQAAYHGGAFGFLYDMQTPFEAGSRQMTRLITGSAIGTS
jgi:hypothetical protein